MRSLRTSRRRTRNRALHRGRGGVSDVVATILLLALTVVLFSSIFAFVTSFPPPPAQNTSQFSANLVLTSNQSYVQGIQVTHLAGPSIPGSSLIYLKSARFPQAPEFATPIAASAGLGGAKTWNLGQIFNYTFPALQQPILPDNITVLIVANDQLVFATVLPGQTIEIPPSFLSTSVAPANPVIGQAFTVYATALGGLGAAKVYVNLANLPGLAGVYPTPQVMTYLSATNQWSFAVPGMLTTTNGTFFAFVNVTGTLGYTATAAVTVPIVSTGVSSSILSVAVGLSTVPSMGSTTTFVAYVTYTGGATAAALNVSFYANRTTGSAGVYTAFVSAGPSGTTISGPSTVSVFATKPWPVPTNPGTQALTIRAVVTIAGVGTASGSYVYSPPLGLGPGTLTAAASHNCNFGTTCPLIDSRIWLNSSAFFGGGPFTFTASIYVNYTSNGTNAKTWSTNAGTLTASPVTLTAGVVSTLTPTTEWKPHVAGLAYEVDVIAYVTGVGLVECQYLTTGTST